MYFHVKAQHTGQGLLQYVSRCSGKCYVNNFLNLLSAYLKKLVKTIQAIQKYTKLLVIAKLSQLPVDWVVICVIDAPTTASSG